MSSTPKIRNGVIIELMNKQLKAIKFILDTLLINPTMDGDFSKKDNDLSETCETIANSFIEVFNCIKNDLERCEGADLDAKTCLSRRALELYNSCPSIIQNAIKKRGLDYV